MSTTNTNTFRFIKLLEKIHSTERIKINVDLFSTPTEIVLLDFIGADKYFITEFGAIWHRDKVFTNVKGKLTKGYLPVIIKDAWNPYPWTQLPTSTGSIWFPNNQLLGWAFQSYTEMTPKFFTNENPRSLPMELNDFQWKNEISKEDTLLGKFMKGLYE